MNILIFLFSSTITYAQDNTIMFEHLGVNDGLPHNIVSSVVQDKQGFMWFGTANGLCRYDGINFKVFQHIENDTTSISGNVVQDVMVDSEGIIWLVTSITGIIEEFNADNETFVHHRVKSDKSFVAITEDKSHNLWINFEDSGILKYSKNGNQTYFSENKNNLDKNLISSEVHNVICDKNNNIWMSTDNGLSFYNQKEESFLHYNDSILLKSKSFFGLGEVKIGDKHEIWTKSTSGPLLALNYHGKLTKKYNLFVDGQVYTGNLGHIFQDSLGNIWLTIGIKKGLAKVSSIEENNIRCDFFEHKENQPNSMSDNYIHDIFLDKQGILWIATQNKINKIDFNKKPFFHYSNQLSLGKKLKSNQILSFYETSRNEIFIGTEKGLNIFKNGQVLDFAIKGAELPVELTENAIWSIAEDKFGNLWFGGLFFLIKFNRQNNEFKKFSSQNGDFGWSILWKLMPDKSGNIWIGGTGRGMYIYNVQEEEFQQFESIPTACGDLPTMLVSCIYHDKKGNTWFGANNHLVKYIPLKDTYIDYQCKLPEIKEFSLQSVYEDEQGMLWLGTQGQGVICFDPEKEEIIKQFTKEDGLPDNTIWAILPDNNGNYWVSTNNGISKISKTGQNEYLFRNFDYMDGLQGKVFKQGAFLKTSNNKLFFGGNNGFNMFYPENIKENPFLPEIALVGIKVYGKNIGIGDTINESIILKKSISRTKDLSLTYLNDFIELEFAALHFSNPSKNKYAYKIKGKNKDWINIGNEHKVQIMNLSPGDYTLMVKATNNDGIWSEPVNLLNVKQLPPWWKTWWFRTIIIIIIISFISLIFYVRTKKMRERQKDLQQKVDNATQEIKTRNAKLQETQQKLNKIIDEVKSQLQTSSVELTDAINKQASSTEEISASVDQVTEKIRDNAFGAKEIYNKAISVKKEATITTDTVSEALGAILEISKEINFISDIAKQTKFIALNAAIEAARAGIYGKSFTVVAKEVKKLSDESHEASKRIESLSAQGINLSEKSSNSILGLLNNIKNIVELIQKINTSNQEQSMESEKIRDVIREAATYITETSQLAEQLNDAINTLSV